MRRISAYQPNPFGKRRSCPSPPPFAVRTFASHFYVGCTRMSLPGTLLHPISSVTGFPFSSTCTISLSHPDSMVCVDLCTSFPESFLCFPPSSLQQELTQLSLRFSQSLNGVAIKSNKAIRRSYASFVSSALRLPAVFFVFYFYTLYSIQQPLRPCFLALTQERVHLRGWV